MSSFRIFPVGPLGRASTRAWGSWAMETTSGRGADAVGLRNLGDGVLRRQVVAKDLTKVRELRGGALTSVHGATGVRIRSVSPMPSPLWNSPHSSFPPATPTSGQLAAARFRLHAQHHPVGHSALWAGGAGVVALLLAGLLTAPNLTDPAGVPGWVLGAVAIMTLAVALLAGVAAYSIVRGTPASPETDPVRYAVARLSGSTGPPDTWSTTSSTCRTRPTGSYRC